MVSYEQTDFLAGNNGTSENKADSAPASNRPVVEGGSQEKVIPVIEKKESIIEDDIDENCPICGGTGPCVRCARGRRFAEAEKRKFKGFR